MLREIDLKEALRAFVDHRDVIVLMDTDEDMPHATKLSNLIDLLFSEKYHFMFDDGEMLDDVGSTSAVEEAVEEAPSQLTKKTHESTKSQSLAKQKLRTKTPQVVRKIEPREEEPFDYGKLGALIMAGKTIDFLQSEFKCTRSQIAARIRIWRNMEEEKNGRVETGTDVDHE